jgi:hypothetical protein
MAVGPDFSDNTKKTLANRAGQICSNPDCKRATSGPHSDKNKATNLGKAAHIKGAREGSARYDSKMTDKERCDISNGIWLCLECADKIDKDEIKYPVELLVEWKKKHEKWILDGKPDNALRELIVKNGGTGSIIKNEGNGIALDIQHHGKGTAERIVVEGSGVGEIITNTGRGIGKRIVSSGGGSAPETKVIVDKPVNTAFGLSSTMGFKNCNNCGQSFQYTKVIQAFAGVEEPKTKVRCPHCGSINII